ncbi:hypothetical protein [Oceanobacillus senegalensis]|nr:hypothetical protein [Oceanobacillus senegalensis]
MSNELREMRMQPDLIEITEEKKESGSSTMSYIFVIGKVKRIELSES